MAKIYKRLRAEDSTTTKTLLHEAIPLTGAVVSGTYGTYKVEENVKNFSHGMFQSIYDYPYLSSSANHVMDVTVGYSSGSTLSSSTNTQNGKKINIYTQMAKMLAGHSASGEIRDFDLDGDYSTTGDKMRECIFLNFSRLLVKDEIKKGSFTLELGVSSGSGDTFLANTHPIGASYEDISTQRIKIQDVSGSTEYRTNSPAGEYGFLYVTGSKHGAAGTPGAKNVALMNISASQQTKVGIIYYQAGVVVLSCSIFQSCSTEKKPETGILSASLSMSRELGSDLHGFASTHGMVGNATIGQFLTGVAISGCVDAVRHRIYNVSFNNTTEINSRIYFCRLSHNQFNYSTNPTYLSASKLVVKENSTDPSVAYATTVGLYGPRNELLAVAKLSEPLRKDPSTELTLRVRLDY